MFIVMGIDYLKTIAVLLTMQMKERKNYRNKLSKYTMEKLHKFEIF